MPQLKIKLLLFSLFQSTKEEFKQKSKVEVARESICFNPPKRNLNPFDERNELALDIRFNPPKRNLNMSHCPTAS